MSVWTFLLFNIAGSSPAGSFQKKIYMHDARVHRCKTREHIELRQSYGLRLTYSEMAKSRRKVLVLCGTNNSFRSPMNETELSM